ncbi:MAG: Na+/H+ antiporter subunit E [Pseudomonadota bacterium]
MADGGGSDDAPFGAPPGVPTPSSERAANWASGRALVAAVVSALAWLALTAADPASLIVGVPSIALAALVAGRVGRAEGGPAQHGLAQALAVPGFLLRLMADVFASAWSLALQVFRPRLNVDPGLVSYRLSLLGPEARAAFMNSVTLTPGTLSATLDGEVLAVHALDRRGNVAGELAALEARTAALYGQTMGEPVTRGATAGGAT